MLSDALHSLLHGTKFRTPTDPSAAAIHASKAPL